MPSSVSLLAIAVFIGATNGLPPAAPPAEQVNAVPADPTGSDDDAVARGTSRDAASRYDEVGLASWYGEEQGANARAANGERFDPAAITIAHRTLPLGSFVEITSIATGRTIVARVTDRGPRRRDRLTDLSRGAAQLLGTYGRSVAAVRVRSVTLSPDDAAALKAGQPATPRLDETPQLLAALRKRMNGEPSHGIDTIAGKPAPISGSSSESAAATSGYSVRIGHLADHARARAAARRLGGEASAIGGSWRVTLGPFATSAEAKRARDDAAKRGYGRATIVRQD